MKNEDKFKNCRDKEVGEKLLLSLTLQIAPGHIKKEVSESAVSPYLFSKSQDSTSA